MFPIKILAYEREYFLFVSLNRNCLNRVSTCAFVSPLLSLGENLSTLVETAFLGCDLKYFIIFCLSKGSSSFDLGFSSVRTGCSSPGNSAICTASSAEEAAEGAISSSAKALSFCLGSVFCADLDFLSSLSLFSPPLILKNILLMLTFLEIPAFLGGFFGVYG